MPAQYRKVAVPETFIIMKLLTEVRELWGVLDG